MLNFDTRKVLLFVCSLTFLCCGDGSFAPELGIDLEVMTLTPSGLYYQDIVVGDGETLETGDLISVHYTGWLKDGTQFDSSRDRGTPFEFHIGEREVIQGWDEGIATMRVGGRRKLVIPPELGYGERGSGNGTIPGGATLVFDVELLEIR